MENKVTRYSLTTLDKNDVKILLEKVNIEQCENMETLGIIAENIYSELHELFPQAYTDEKKGPVIAWTGYKLAEKAVNYGIVKPLEYLRFYAQLKKDEFLRGDYGAFGDLLEVLVRVKFLKNIHLLRVYHLKVQGQGITDIISKKYGKIEVGHNGKTWASASRFDYMNGDFSTVVYGMFSDMDREKVFNYMKKSDYEKALAFIGKRCGVWTNKYNFLSDMDNLSRGKGIAEKGNNIQSQSNESRYYMFIDAIDSGRFTSLNQLLGE